MPVNHYRIILEISKKAIKNNFKTISNKVYPAQIMPVLKADAYGLQVKNIYPLLKNLSIKRVALASISEAIEIRKIDKKIELQILGDILPQELEDAIKHRLILPINDKSSLFYISKEAKKQNKKVKVQLLLDTGMGRLGITRDHFSTIYQMVGKNANLQLEGAYTHFANANNRTHFLNLKQIKEFNHFINCYPVQLKHIANSDAVNNLMDYLPVYDFVRIGINLYGVFDLKGKQNDQLKHSLTLKSFLITKRYLKKGSTIGYDSTVCLKEDKWVGTLPIGYADGVPVEIANQGYVLYRGKRLPVIGKISMDYMTIDLTDCDTIKKGDSLILIGCSQNKKQNLKEIITVEDWARMSGTIPYDIICRLGNRVQRIVV